MVKLTDEQIKAVNHFNGPALVLAVPGSGKTTVLLNRCFNLINKYNVNPKNILSITFSKASSMDMKSRFLRDYKVESPFFATIHSFCFSIVRRYYKQKNLRYNLIENTKSDINKYNILKKLYFKYNHDYISEDDLDILINDIGYVKNTMLEIDKFLEIKEIPMRNFKSIYLDYEKLKKDKCLLDFDDMLTLSLSILKSDDNNLLEIYRKQFKYIQVDEGQDTSRLQLEIIKLLTYPNNNLFIVADDDQSIYGFRGASPSDLLSLDKELDNLKFYYMEQNFRSSKDIVSISNEFIKTNKCRYKKNIYTENSTFEPIKVIHSYSSENQYDTIIKLLNDLELENTCILYRNNISSIGIINSLNKYNIPYKIKDMNFKFFNHWVIKDIFNFLDFSKDLSNINIYRNIYYKHEGYLSKDHINFASKLNSNLNVFDRIIQFPGINIMYQRKLRVLKMDFNKLSKLSPFAAIDFIEYELGYKDYLKEYSENFGSNYNNLVQILYYLKIISKDCSTFDEVKTKLQTMVSSFFNNKDNHYGVNLSTVHSSKGLEFENVIIVDLINNEFPNLYLADKDNNLEEERRLFYVAMTRAKKRLYLFTLQQFDHLDVEESLFISEIKSIKKEI